MASEVTKNDCNEYLDAADAIYEVVDELLNKNINPGCIASCLTMHATRLSFVTCDDPTLIFQNILTSLLDNIPAQSKELEPELVNKITHQTTNLLN